MVMPTVYGSDSNTLYFHGSVASRSLVASPTATVCVTVTHIDGVVLARSVFEHGVNYRSAMIFGTPRLVTDPDEKWAGLRCLTEQATPGQWDYARQPTRKELAATSLRNDLRVARVEGKWIMLLGGADVSAYAVGARLARARPASKHHVLTDGRESRCGCRCPKATAAPGWWGWSRVGTEDWY